MKHNCPECDLAMGDPNVRFDYPCENQDCIVFSSKFDRSGKPHSIKYVGVSVINAKKTVHPYKGTAMYRGKMKFAPKGKTSIPEDYILKKL